MLFLNKVNIFCISIKISISHVATMEVKLDKVRSRKTITSMTVFDKEAMIDVPSLTSL